MRRDFYLPLVLGVVIGALLMMFWQFNARLNNAGTVLTQLQQATSQNTKTVNDVVSFINQATGANNAASGQTQTQQPAE